MKRVSKKLLAIVSTAVLTLAMGVSAMAAPSPTATGTVTAATSSTGAAITVSTISSADKIASVSEVSSLVTAAGISVENATILDQFELSTQDVGKLPCDVTLTVAGITTSTKAVVLHKVNGAWTAETTEVGNGTITIKNLQSMSPFAIVVDKTTTTAKASTGTSPKTGETSVIAIVSLAALLAGAVAVTSRKRA